MGDKIKSVYAKVSKIFFMVAFTIGYTLSTRIPLLANNIGDSRNDQNVISKFGEQYDTMLENSTESIWTAGKPFINLLIYALVAIGIILILGAIGYIAMNAIKTITGKQGLTKEVARNFAIAMVIGVLITTTGWVGILNFTQVVVDSGVKIINDAESTASGHNSGGNTLE